MSIASSTAREWGVIGIGVVVFDLACGQKLESFFPPDADITAEHKLNLANSALPTTHKHTDGDTQFCFRYRKTSNVSLFSRPPNEQAFQYGYVLFRQRRDDTSARGYFQKAVVLVTEKPYVQLYEKMIRVVGPLLFEVGHTLLQAVFENIAAWPSPAEGTIVRLPLAGTYITCALPIVSEFDRITDQQTNTRQVKNGITEVLQRKIRVLSESDRFTDSESESGSPLGSPKMAETNAIIVEEEKSHEGSEFEAGGMYQAIDAPPSLADILTTTGNENDFGAFQSLGLYSGFQGLARQLWHLWELAITGDSLLVVAPNASMCSQAVLSFISMIAPISFCGDFRPYFTIYDPDFQSMSELREGSHISTTVLGVTNPFFLKALSHWPNALFLASEDYETSDHGTQVSSASFGTPTIKSEKIIKKAALLDSFDELLDSSKFICRHAPIVQPDPRVLRQLLSAPPSQRRSVTMDDEPYAAINNALLRQHFKQLTSSFLRPFERYFGIGGQTAEQHARSGAYIDTLELLEKFDEREFFRDMEKNGTVPVHFRNCRWRSLYRRFINSPHFCPWFNKRRAERLRELDGLFKVMRMSTDEVSLLRSRKGGKIVEDDYIVLYKQIRATLRLEESNPQKDEALMEKMRKDLNQLGACLSKSTLQKVENES